MTPTNMLLFDHKLAVPEPGAPAADRIVEGSPRNTTWNLYESEDGKTYSGIWESTPGAWRIIYDEWEFCHIVSGISIISDEDGNEITVKAGDAFTLAPGFRGIWKVVETTRKHYVIELPRG